MLSYFQMKMKMSRRRFSTDAELMLCRRIVKALVAFSLISFWAEGRAGGMVLAERGRATKSVILLPENASESQCYAAEELQTHLRLLADVTLPIVTDAQPLPLSSIMIGTNRHSSAVFGHPFGIAELGTDGFRLIASPPHLMVLGSPTRGCLYGVYELLERYGGCRWYASWHALVPSVDAFVVPQDLDLVQVPDFQMRYPWWFDVSSHAEFAARLRVNAHPGGTVPAKFGGDAFRFSRLLSHCHTLDSLLPQKTYRHAHPDYYSRNNGSSVQPCLTHPDVLAIVTSNVLRRVRKDSGAMVFGVNQNDNRNHCTCSRCAAVDEEEGGSSGTMVRFANAIAEVVEREYPGKFIETQAYRRTRKPPLKTPPRHNVIPCLSSIECDFALPIPESPFETNKAFLEDVRGWSRLTDRLCLWDYSCNFSHYPFPFPNCHAMQGNLRLFRDCGVKEIIAQGAYQGYLADFAELKVWLLAKWMWNVGLPIEDLLSDFFPGFYGRGSPFVRRYFDRLHALQQNASRDMICPLGIADSVDSPALSDDFFAWAAGTMREALALERDPFFARNIRRTAFSVDFVRFLRNARQACALLWFSEAEPSADLRRVAHEQARRMQAVIEEVGDVRLCEFRQKHTKIMRQIREAAGWTSDEPLRRVKCGVVEECELVRVCRMRGRSEFVDDSAAGDGRALKIFGSHYEWSTDFPMSLIVYDDSQRLRLRVRCRADLIPDRQGEAFWMGVYDSREHSCSLKASIPVSAVQSRGYAWYDLGLFNPTDNQIFWIGPGRFGKDGKSNIGALYVDCIELSCDEERRK